MPWNNSTQECMMNEEALNTDRNTISGYRTLPARTLNKQIKLCGMNYRRKFSPRNKLYEGNNYHRFQTIQKQFSIL